MPPNFYDQAGGAGAPPTPLPTPTRALTIGAHPDDAEFGAGGTLARWADAGCAITILVVTDGSKGSWDPDIDQEALVSSRRIEQRAAADVLGVADLVMLDHVDGELEYSMALRREICGWVRATRPDVVLSHDPWKRYMLHPDHRATGLAAVDGVVAARDHLYYPELGAKHRPDTILLWSADEPDHAEPISDTLERKVTALLCHSSQGETTMGGADGGGDAADHFERRIRGWADQQGEPFGIGPAEVFKRLQP